MEESTSIAVVPSAPASVPTVVEAPSSPATIPPSVTEAPFESAVSSKHLPLVNGKISQQEFDRLASLADAETERQAADPPPVAWEKGQVTEEYKRWMERQTNPAARRTPRAPAVSKEFKALGYSSNDEAWQTLTTVRDLYEKPDGPANALAEVEKRSPEVFNRIRNLVIASNPHLSLKQSALLTGWDMDEEPAPSNELPHDLARHIPPDLQQTARTVPQDLLYLWAEKGTDTLVYNLQQESQAIEAQQQQTAEFNQQWEKAITEAEATGHANLAALVGQFESAHHKELEKWRPFGASKEANEATRRMAFAGALDHLLSDQKWLDIHNRLSRLITAAPNGRLFGQHAMADEAEREARQLAQQFSTRLGQMIRDQVKLVDNAIRGAIAHAVEEALQQQANAPLAPMDESRSMRPGEPPRRDPKSGRTSSAWLDWLSKHLPNSDESSRAETLNQRREVTG